MPDGVNIDWSLARPIPDFVGGAMNAYAAGRGLAQQLGVQKALATAGSDPAGAANRLLAFGDINDAVALLNYQKTGTILDLSRRLMGGPDPAGTVQSGPPDQQPQQPQSAPQPVQSSALPDLSGAQPDQLAHAGAVLDTFDRLGVELSALPYEQRKARLAQELPTLVTQGVPAQILNGFDPTDANIAQAHESIAETRRHIMQNGPQADMRAVPGGANQPAPPMSMQAPQGAAPPLQAPSAPMVAPAPAPPPVSPSGGIAGGVQGGPSQRPPLDMRNPETARTVMGLGLLDPQGVGPILDIAKMTTPQGQPSRPGSLDRDQFGNVMGTPGPDGLIYGTPNVDGSVPAYDPRTNTFSLLPAGHAIQTQSALAAASAEGKGRGELAHAGEIAQATAAGTGRGEAPFKLVTIDMPPDGDHPGGYTVQMTLDEYKALHGGAGVGGGRIGASAGPGGEQFAKDDAAAFSKTVAEQADPQTIMGYQRAATTATQAAHAAMAINPNAWTPKEKAVADTLNVFHLDSARANDLNYYASLIPQVTKTTFKTFPRLEKEFETVKAAIPGLKTPRDAAALTFASIAATNNQNAAFARFVNDYHGVPSQRGLNAAWQHSPDGSRSIFADPVFRGLTMDGKPAVYINPTPFKGHVYGVFRPGTPQAQTFLVQ